MLCGHERVPLNCIHESCDRSTNFSTMTTCLSTTCGCQIFDHRNYCCVTVSFTVIFLLYDVMSYPFTWFLYLLPCPCFDFLCLTLTCLLRDSTGAWLPVMLNCTVYSVLFILCTACTVGGTIDPPTRITIIHRQPHSLMQHNSFSCKGTLS